MSENVLHVVMNGRVIGDIQRTGRRSMRLRYTVDTSSPRFVPLSLSMPGTKTRYRESAVEPWLEGLLPDRPELLNQWRRAFGVTEIHVFPLLRHVGEDVAGAAQFVRPDRLDPLLARESALTPVDDAAVADRLRRARANIPILDTEHSLGKFSLAGTQAKIALQQTDDGWADPAGSEPSTHILKPPIPGMDDQDLVELVSMRAAALLGLRTADCEVLTFDNERALVTTRFDRARSTDRWVRVHQEDLAQALGVAPSKKYQNQGGPPPAQIADLIRRASGPRGEDDVQRFAQAVIYNWLICGTDAHTRNYSMLLAPGQARLAPLYDVNSYLAYSDGQGLDLSMQVGHTYRAAAVRRSDWNQFAADVGVDSGWLLAEVHRLAAALPDAMSDVCAADDVAVYRSPVIDRLRANINAWVAARTSLVLDAELGAATQSHPSQTGAGSPGSPDRERVRSEKRDQSKVSLDDTPES